MGPLAQAPLRSRKPNRCVQNRDSPGTVDGSLKGHRTRAWPIGGSDRTGESLLHLLHGINHMNPLSNIITAVRFVADEDGGGILERLICAAGSAVVDPNGDVRSVSREAEAMCNPERSQVSLERSIPEKVDLWGRRAAHRCSDGRRETSAACVRPGH